LTTTVQTQEDELLAGIAPDPNRHSETDALEAWIIELSTELEIDPTAIDRDLLLATSRVAHGVTRAAAPITLFLVGLATGKHGGSADAMARAATTAQRLAAAHI
jgi:hypothetical protein